MHDEDIYKACGLFLLVMLLCMVLFGTSAQSQCELTHSADVCFDQLNR